MATSFLHRLQRLGDRLPNPVTLFVLATVLVVLTSSILARSGVTVLHPKDGSAIAAVDLLSPEMLRRMFTDAVKNFMGFAPLGTVLAAMIGVGVAERSGLVAAALRAFVHAVPRRLLTAAVIFTGITAHVAADAGIIVLPPLAGALFAAVGRHPLAGIAAAFAGLAGGFSANFLPTILDVLLAGFTQEAATSSRLLPGYSVQVLGNYYFLAASTPLLTLVGAVVTERVVEPWLGRWTAPPDSPALELGALTSLERRGLWAAAGATLLVLGLLLLLALPAGAILHGAGDSALARARPVLDSLIVWVLLFFLIPGVAYGVATRTVKSDHDVARMAGDALGTMGGYVVLAFVAAQLIAYFSWSNLGAILAISGAELLRSLGLSGPGLLVGLVLLTAALNLLVSSATAKWAVMAPVFVPMFALLGVSPEGTQLVFRIGDSTTNIITPLFPYLPILLGVLRRFEPAAGTGRLLSVMVPYSAAFLVAWTALLLLWTLGGWAIGPGASIFLPAGG